MPPLIALLLCTVFVVALLWLEHKQSLALSGALWIPTIWFLSCGTKGLGNWLMIGSDIESGSPLDRAFLIILFCLGLIILHRRKFDWSTAAKEYSWLLVLMSFMTLSLLWSDMPWISFRRWMREVVAVVIAFIVSSESNPRLSLKSILRRAIYILIPFSIILIKYFPQYGREYNRWTGETTWVGVSSQKNGLARICIISVLFLAWAVLTKRKKQEVPVSKYIEYIDIFMLLLSLYLLGGPYRTLRHSATSSASLIGGLFLLATLLLVKRRGKAIGHIAIMALLTLTIIYGSATPFLGKLEIFDVSSYFGRTENLTGRANIWAILIPYAMRRPILGYGVGGFWTTAMREMTSAHAHNGYLELILHFGFVGLIIFSLFLLACCRRAIRTLAEDFNWGVLFIVFLFMTVIYNIAEVSIYTFTSPLSSLIVLFFVTLKDTDIIKQTPGHLS